MLRASVLQFGDDWQAKLDLMEFAYINSYHSSIGMAPLETLYGKLVVYLCVGLKLVKDH